VVESESRPVAPATGAEPQEGRTLPLDIIVPVIMGCAMLWWVSRGMSWTRVLAVAAVTLVLIVIVVLFERSRF
jgi:1,4-dihydroxy-2-naphthoate octaprenyltransferase